MKKGAKSKKVRCEPSLNPDSENAGDQSVPSPYLSPHITLLIGSNSIQYTVHEDFLKQYSALMVKVEKYSHLKQYSALMVKVEKYSHPLTIHLPEVDEEIGHVVVHYLYTSEFQLSSILTPFPPALAKREFSKSVRTYFTARKYGLSGLEDHAKNRMESMCTQLSALEIFRTVKETYGNAPSDEFWIPGLLRTKIGVEFESDEALFSQECFLDLIGQDLAFNKILFKSMQHAYELKLVSRTRDLSCQKKIVNEDNQNCEVPLAPTCESFVDCEDPTVCIEQTSFPEECTPVEVPSFHEECAPIEEPSFDEECAPAEEPLDGELHHEEVPLCEEAPTWEDSCACEESIPYTEDYPCKDTPSESYPSTCEDTPPSESYSSRYEDSGPWDGETRYKEPGCRSEPTASEEASLILAVEHDGGDSICPFAAEHIFGVRWKSCTQCQSYIRQLHNELQ